MEKDTAAETETEDTGDDEEVAIDEELHELYGQAEEMGARYGVHVKRLEADKAEPATKGDIAELYHAMGSDLLSLVRDTIAASGAALTYVVDMVSDGGGDDDDDDDGIDDDALQVYSALRANENAYTEMLKSPTITDDMRKGIQSLLEMNRGALRVFQKQFGDDIEKALQDTIKQASQGGTDGGAEAKTTAATA